MKEVRPTTGKALQALFNILGNLRGKTFLDLFSGTGRVAFEACRRGAAPVVSAELVRARSRDIWKANSYEDHIHLCMDVRKALSWVARRNMVFDVIFADPPYEAGWGKTLPDLISGRRDLLSETGVFILEHSKSEDIIIPDGMILSQERTYGRSVFSFMKIEKREEGSI